jgi:hypothetical protein
MLYFVIAERMGLGGAVSIPLHLVAISQWATNENKTSSRRGSIIELDTVTELG